MFPLPRSRRLRFALALSIVAIVFWLGSSYYVVHRLTQRLRPRTSEPLPELTWASPEVHVLETADGERIGCWWFEGEEGRPCVVLLHGNGGTRRGSLEEARFLVEAGYGALALTLRVHGDSTGEVNDFGRSAAEDVLAAVAFLGERAPGREVVVHGHSLGAAAAIFAADDLGQDVAAYVLESPYRDLMTAVRHRTRQQLPFPLDRVASLGLRIVAPFVLDDPLGIAPIQAIGAMPGDLPVLFLAGGRDHRAPVEEVDELRAARDGLSRIVVFPGAAHGQLSRSDPERYRRVLLEFLGEVGG